MWELQGPDGAWEYPTSFYSPPLGDSYYGAAFAALAVGIAPDGYADTRRRAPAWTSSVAT